MMFLLFLVSPLLLSERMKEKKVLLYELALHLEQITETRDQIGEELTSLSYDSRTVFRVMLLYE